MNAMTSASTGTSLPARRSGLTLNVLDGLHRGVAAPITGDICTIGSGSDCDVVLADPAIMPDHLRLRFYGRQVAVDALGGDVTIEGRAPVLRGHGCRTALPVTLGVGAARLEVRRDDAGDRRGMLVALGSVLLAAVAVLVATQSSGFGVAEGPRDAPAPEARIAAPATPGTADELRARIADAGLDLAVIQDGHHLAVSGTVTQEQTAAWTDVQRWFDGSFGGRSVLSSRVTTASPATPPKFAFQAVWFGQNPYVVDTRGERRYPGAALQGGWMLKSIEGGAITVTRDGKDFQLTL